MYPSQSALLKKYGLRTRKKLGQHFLTNPHVLERIVQAVADLHPEKVVEMGSGAGALTFALLEAGFRVHALEVDDAFIELLRAETAGRDIDVEKVDLAKEDFTRHCGDESLVFAGNLPYQVTSPVVFGLLNAMRHPQTRGAVLMIQAEVADRMVAPPGGRDYGILAVLLSARVEIRRLFGVKAGCFLPPPEVSSAVVSLVPRPDPVDLGESGIALVKALFQQRRKQIGGLLRRKYDISLDDVARMAADTGLDPACRPQEMTLENFLQLARWLDSRTKH